VVDPVVSDVPATDELGVDPGADPGADPGDVVVVERPTVDFTVVDFGPVVDERVVDVARGAVELVVGGRVVVVGPSVVGEGFEGTPPDDAEGGRTSRYSASVTTNTAPRIAVDFRTRRRFTRR
jgi:hypothetical protein